MIIYIKQLMPEMILLINQCFIRLGFTIERKSSDFMTQHMTMGLGHIQSSKFNITQDILCGGFPLTCLIDIQGLWTLDLDLSILAM